MPTAILALPLGNLVAQLTDSQVSSNNQAALLFVSAS